AQPLADRPRALGPVHRPRVIAEPDAHAPKLLIEPRRLEVLGVVAKRGQPLLQVRERLVALAGRPAGVADLPVEVGHPPPIAAAEDERQGVAPFLPSGGEVAVGPSRVGELLEDGGAPPLGVAGWMRPLEAAAAVRPP